MTSRLKISLAAILFLIPVLAYCTPSSTIPRIEFINEYASTFPELGPRERVSKCRSLVEETSAETRKLESRLESLESDLAANEALLQSLPSKMKSAVAAEEELRRNLSAELASQSQAEDALSAYRAEMGVHTAAAQRNVDRVVAGYSKDEFDKVDAARRQRDATRARVGALPSGQDEAILARRLKARATAQQVNVRDQANAQYLRPLYEKEASFVAAVSRHSSVVKGIEADLSSAISSITDLESQAIEIPRLILATTGRIRSTRDSISNLKVVKSRQTVALETAALALKASDDSRQWSSASYASVSPVRIPDYRSLPPARLPSPRVVAPVYADERPAYTYVSGYTRANGTQVKGHCRTIANGDPFDTWSTKGNINPFTGKRGSHRP